MGFENGNSLISSCVETFFHVNVFLLSSYVTTTLAIPPCKMDSKPGTPKRTSLTYVHWLINELAGEAAQVVDNLCEESVKVDYKVGLKERNLKTHAEV